MTFEDLKAQNAEHNAKLDRILEMNTRLVRDASNAKARKTMKWSKPSAILELVISIIAVVWLGDFISGVTGELQFLIPAVLLDTCAIAFLGSRVMQLVVLSTLDYEGSTENLQNGFENLRRLRNRTSKWVASLSFVLWLPTLIVGIKGLLGVDPYQLFGVIADSGAPASTWMLANIAFGVAAMLAAIWFSNRRRTSNNAS